MSSQAKKSPSASGKTAVAPVTLARLFGMVLKNMLKGGLIKIPLALGLSFLALLMHTFLLVVVNEGYGSVDSFVGNFLAIKNQLVSGTLFWTLSAGLATAIFTRLRQVGISKTLKGIQSAPSWVMGSFKASGFSAPGLLLAVAGITLLVGTWIGNRVVSLQLAIATIGALIAQHESFSYLVMNAAWGDSQRLLKRTPTRLNPAWAAISISGAVLGFGSAIILPFAPYLGCAGSFMLIGVSLALILIQKNKPGMGRTLLILGVLLSIALLATPALADDSGWSEGGSSFSSWIRTKGSILGIIRGVPPSMGVALGILFGSSFIPYSGLGTGSVPGVVPDAPDAPPPPSATPPNDEWAQEWVNKGWVWSDAEDGFVPKSGAINDQNQVWYHPPWEQGGSYWIDKAEHDNIQQHLSNGHEWSDRWGWQQSGEINRLNQERDDRWSTFADPAEIRRQQIQMEQRIQQNIANTPLSAVEQKLKDLKEKAWKRERDFQQKQFDYYNNRADRFEKLENGARYVKKGADVTIDILGMAPGAGRTVKYAYKFASNTAQTTAETGDLTKGIAKGIKETGKSYLGDKLGDAVNIPGVRNPTNWSKMPVKTFIREAVKPKNIIQLGLNRLKDKAASKIVDRADRAQRLIRKNW